MTTLDPNPQLDDALILRLQYDLATGMHNAGVIAQRYGLVDEAGLRMYLMEHPQLVYEARRMKALFNSDEATEGRIRTKFLRATELLIMPMTALVNDPRTPIAQRIDGFKQIQRGAGVDGAPAAAREAGKAGAPFSLTINFAGGRGRETITGTTTVVENEIPPPREPMLALGGLREHTAEDAEYEDVEV